MSPDMRERLIVGLDVASTAEADRIVAALGDSAHVYKIGYQLAYAGGLPLVRELSQEGKRVFLDLKLLDIPNTVAKGVEAAIELGAAMLTIHAYPHAMRAAVDAARGSDLTLLGVTVLTALDDADLGEAGYGLSVGELVEKRAAQAREIGMGGLVASAAEAGALRAIVGPGRGHCQWRIPSRRGAADRGRERSEGRGRGDPDRDARVREGRLSRYLGVDGVTYAALGWIAEAGAVQSFTKP